MAVSDTAVGEALLNYGYMKAKGSRGYWGRGDMNRGLSLIKDNPIARLRGLRKMADVSRKPEAMKCLEEARALASKDGVMDQLLQIDAAIKALMGK